MQPTVLIIFYESMFDEFTNDYYAIIIFKYTRNNILVGCYLCVKYISNVLQIIINEKYSITCTLNVSKTSSGIPLD